MSQLNREGEMNSRVLCTDLAIVSEWQDGTLRRFEDSLATEEPLEIRAGGISVSVTMRTPGHDAELAVGFLYTEGLIQSRNQITSIHQSADAEEQKARNTVVVELAGIRMDRRRLQRNFFATSSCGICGKASIDSVRVRGIKTPNPDFRMDPELLCTFPQKLQAAQTIFGRTGGLHAAAIFDSQGELVAIREDVGRHNAVDKVVGWSLLEGRSLSEDVMMVSGRGGFEIIQKALVVGLPVVASVSAPSSLAVHLSREIGLTLVGFLRGRRFVVYAGEERLGIGDTDKQFERLAGDPSRKPNYQPG